MNTPQSLVVIPADLGAADAPEARADLLRRLQEEAASVTVELGREAATPSPLALQLLAAAVRSTRFAPAACGPRAESALQELGRARTVEETP